MQPEIRVASVEDLPSLADLYRQLNPEEEAIPPNQFAAVSEEILSSKRFELVVAECDGKLVGTCYFNVIPNLTRGARPYAVIENVVVTSDLRNRGIGKALLRYAFGPGSGAATRPCCRRDPTANGFDPAAAVTAK